MGGEKEGRKKARGPRAKSNNKKNERDHCEDEANDAYWKAEFAQGCPLGIGQGAAAVAFEICKSKTEANYRSKEQQPYADVEHQASDFIQFHKPMFYNINPQAKVMV